MSSATTTAMIIMGVGAAASAGASIYGANKSANAAQQAATTESG